jgi:predicted nucleic acid-binding Zn ribbon protein
MTKNKKDLARELYKSFRTHSRRRQANGEEEVRSNAGDPQPLKNIMDSLVASRSWKQGIAEGTLFTDWHKVVGADIAKHSTPISLVDGLLTIQSSSTAWATQLNVIKDELLKTISSSAPGALVETITIIGPNGPTWKKGLRTIKGGRGPRDTFG